MLANFRLLATYLLAALLLVPALAAGQGSNRRQLTVWGFNLDENSKGDQAAINAFERLHPDIDVRVLNLGAGGMNPQKLLTSIVGDVAPDVINQDRFSLSDWASRNTFLPLDDLIARDRGKDPLCPNPKDYYPSTWAEASYGGHVYGIPTGADDRVLYYNLALFRKHADDLRKAGLDPGRPPRTWSELLAYGKVLTEYNPDGSLRIAGFMPNYGNSWLYMYAFMNDAEFMNAEGTKCTLDSRPAEEALAYMVQGYDQIGGYEKCQAFSSGFLTNENDPFLIGKVAMKIDGNWILDGMSRYHPEIELGCAPPPVPDDRYYGRGRFAHENRWVTWIGGFSLAIPRNAKNVRDAWSFIKFYTSTLGRRIAAIGQREWSRYHGREFIPNLAACKSANQMYLKEFPPADPKFARALALHIELMPFGKIRPATFVGQLLWDMHARAFEDAAYHKADPKTALLDAQAQVQQDLDDFFAKDRFPVLNLAYPLWITVGLGGLLLAGLAVGFARLKIGPLARKEAKWAYLFISPWVIGFLVFTAGPMLASLLFSFLRYDALNEARWVGFKNFGDLGGVNGPLVMKALENSVYLAGIGVPFGLFTGLAIALLLNTATRGMRFYRTFFYMPAIVPGVASAVLWAWILTPDPNKGLINAYWNDTLTPWLHISPPAWLQSADWAKNGLILMGIWGAGSGMILWLAGLKGVPTTMYEAASIDGANSRQQFWAVTFPMLSPVIFFNAVMGFIGAMQEFDRIYVMKPASDAAVGPNDSLLTPVFYLFNNGFEFFRLGFASALAWLVFGIIVLLTFTQWKLAPRWVHYEAEA